MRRGYAALFTLLALVLLGALFAGLPWKLATEARAAAEQVATIRAEAAARGALVAARRYLEGVRPESVSVALARVPPPVRFAGGGIGYAEFAPVEGHLVEILAQGFAGDARGTLARRELCALVLVRAGADSSSPRMEVLDPGRASVIPCPG